MSDVIWNSTNWEALAGPSLYGIFHGMMAMGDQVFDHGKNMEQ